MFFVSIGLGYIGIEIGYRTYLWYVYTVETNYPVVITDYRQPELSLINENNVYGPFQHNVTATIHQFGSEGTLYSRHKVHTNNFGWVSHYDYQIKKPADEFRVAIVGASLAACINNSLPWGDVVQKYLNQDGALLAALGKKHITVLNISAPGSPVEGMGKILFPIAMRFNPDMVFVNLATSNLFDRANGPDPVMEKPLTDKQIAVLTQQSFKEVIPKLGFTIDGVEIPLTCATFPWNLSNMDCKVSSLWYISPDNHFEITEENIHRLKMKVARTVLKKRLILSFKPFVLMELLGHPIIPNPHKRIASAVTPTPPAVTNTALTLSKPIQTKTDFEKNLSTIDHDDMRVGINAIVHMKAIKPNLIVAINPLLPQLRNQTAPNELPVRYFLWKKIKKENVDVVLMDNYLPIEGGDGEWTKWYVKDGHFSDYGAEYYGKAVYAVIRERLLADNHLLSKKEFKSEFCELADESYFFGMESLKQQHPEEALQWFNKALTHYEPQFKNRTSPKEVGFLVKLYQARASIYFDQKEDKKALADWNTALMLAPNQASIYLARGTYYDSHGNLPNAIRDYTHALTVDGLPDELHKQLYVVRGCAFNNAKQYANAVKDFSAFLKMMPDTLDIIKLRASAYVALGQFNKALVDYDAVLAAEPQNTSIKVARNELLKTIENERKKEYCKVANDGYVLGTEAFKADHLGEAVQAFTNALMHYQVQDPKHIKQQEACVDFIVKLYQARASAYLLLKEDNKAQLDWDSALALTPNQVNIYLDRGIYFDSHGDINAAILNYTKAIHVKDISADLYNRLYVLRGCAFNNAGHYADAIKDFNVFLKRMPNTLDIIKLRATAYLALGQFKEAMLDYDAVLALEPQNTSIKAMREALVKKMKMANRVI